MSLPSYSLVTIDIITILEKTIANDGRQNVPLILTHMQTIEFQGSIRTISRGLPHFDTISRIAKIKECCDGFKDKFGKEVE